MKRYRAWYLQAEKDYLWGEDSLEKGHYAQTCFIAQQVAEKLLKSLAFFRGVDLVKSHSLVNISKELKINGELEAAGKRLDLYYISTRYPDALPDHGIPSDYFDKAEAKKALELARLYFTKVKAELGTFK